MSLALSLLLLLLPSRAKIILLRVLGYSVEKSAYIGFSYIRVRNLTMADDAFIGHGNVINNLEYLELRRGSRINRWNKFSSSPFYKGRFILGENASISLRHYFDVCDTFIVGSNTIIAGHRSTFFTHSKGIDRVDYTAAIGIGDWCYVGSNVNFVPGAKIGSYSFIGMGATVTRDFSSQQYVLLAGNPAMIKKKINPDSSYFQQKKITHPHHGKQ